MPHLVTLVICYLIYPSTTRGVKELPSSSALDSPSVLSKLATHTHAINSDMSHVIDDATSAMHDAYDDTMMTHKYRGSVIVLLISKSVKPNEEQKEMTSSF